MCNYFILWFSWFWWDMNFVNKIQIHNTHIKFNAHIFQSVDTINEPYHMKHITIGVFFKMCISSSCLNIIHLCIYLSVLGRIRLCTGVMSPFQDALGRLDISMVQSGRTAKNIFVCFSCLYFF